MPKKSYRSLMRILILFLILTCGAHGDLYFLHDSDGSQIAVDMSNPHKPVVEGIAYRGNTWSKKFVPYVSYRFSK